MDIFHFLQSSSANDPVIRWAGHNRTVFVRVGTCTVLYSSDKGYSPLRPFLLSPGDAPLFKMATALPHTPASAYFAFSYAHFLAPTNFSAHLTIEFDSGQHAGHIEGVDGYNYRRIRVITRKVKRVIYMNE